MTFSADLTIKAPVVPGVWGSLGAGVGVLLTEPTFLSQFILVADVRGLSNPGGNKQMACLTYNQGTILVVSVRFPAAAS